MGYLNKVMLIGRLGQEPEKKVTPQGHSVMTISLATSESYKDKSGTRQEKTEWHRVVLWNQLAELVERYCKKGSQLYVEGSLQTREWQDKDGNKRYTTEVQGRQIQFLDPASGAGQNTQSKGGDPGYGEPPQFDSQTGGGPGGQDEFIEDDIPF